MGGAEDIFDDIANFVDDIAGTEFGSEEQIEDAQNSMAPLPGQIQRPTTASDILAKRKIAKDNRALTKGNAEDIAAVAGKRTGTGKISSGRGKEKKALRAQKFKQSKPLRIGMARPE